MARTGDVGRGTRRHPFTCTTCGREGMVSQRPRGPIQCLPCIRVANGWSCRTCGSSDPEHPSPCPDTPTTA